jgi:predicted HTH domain antitoxin
MSSVAIEIPEATLVALKLDASHAAAELRVAAAMKLYELGRLSSGAAAELAGMSRVAFLVKLGEFGVDTFRESESELADDLAHA